MPLDLDRLEALAQAADDRTSTIAWDSIRELIAEVKRLRNPDTPIVPWHRHADHHPNAGAAILVTLGGTSITYLALYVAGNETPKYLEPNGEVLALAQPDDLWTYLPTPPAP